MSEVQKGGVSNPPQDYIKNEEVQKRPISDQPFMLDSRDIEDKHLFKTMMSPGKFHFLSGRLGIGKTHFLMNLMYLLNQGYDGCGDWEVVTNVFMYRKDENGTKVCAPEHVHHIDSFDEFFEKMVELSETGHKIALFLDDLNRFYDSGGKDSLSRYLRMLILNRRKLRVLLFFSSATDIDEFDNSIPNRYGSDYSWSRYKSRAEWEQSKADTELNLDWDYRDSTFLLCSDDTSGHIRTTVTEWTNFKKTSGWFFDKVSDASVLRFRSDFDFDSFWMGLENVSSLSVKGYIRKYTSSRSEKKIKEDKQCQHEKKIVDLAIRMKSVGLTDEAIECILEVPKTTLRRWVEKAGHQWKIGEIDLPYRFKRINAKEKGASSEVSK